MSCFSLRCRKTIGSTPDFAAPMYLLFRLPGCLPDPGLAPPSSRRSAAIADKGVIVGGPHFDDTIIHTAFSLEYLILKPTPPDLPIPLHRHGFRREGHRNPCAASGNTLTRADIGCHCLSG
jgi:hypothetical protein